MCYFLITAQVRSHIKELIELQIELKAQLNDSSVYDKKNQDIFSATSDLTFP